LEYSGYFQSGLIVGPLLNGAPCRSTVANDPLEGLKVCLIARSDASALPKRAPNGDALPKRVPGEDALPEQMPVKDALPEPVPDEDALPEWAPDEGATPEREPIVATASPAHNHPTGGMAQPHMSQNTQDAPWFWPK
jgi:hypothetical protein